MNVYHNTLELIGRTPLVELNSYSLPREFVCLPSWSL